RRPYGGTYVRTGARGIVAIDHFRRRRAWLVLTSRSACEPLLHGEGGEARARGEAELLQHVLDVARDGVLADEERGRDALVRLAGGDEREHLRLARGEPAGRAGPGRFAVEPRQVGHRAEALEDPARGVGLHGGGLVIAERAAGDSDERARPRRLVGHLDLLPDCPRPAQRRECRARVAGGDEDAAFGAAGQRAQGQGFERPRDAAELGGGGARALDIAQREQRFDVRREELRAARRSQVRLLEGDADRLLRGAGLAARKPEERTARLERPPEVARLAVGLLGILELAAQPVQLGELVEGIGRAFGRRRQRKPVAGAARLLEGVLPVAAQAHHFDAVHEARAAIGHDVRLRFAPARQRGGPLAGAADVEHLVAGLEDAAVDLAGHDRRHFARRDGDHDLVERGDAFARQTELDQRATPAMPRARPERRIGESRGDRLRLREGAAGGGRIAGAELLDAAGEEQVAPLDAVGADLGEQGARAGEPPLRLRHLAGEDHPVADPEREAGRARVVAQAERLAIAARERVARLRALPDQVS